MNDDLGALGKIIRAVHGPLAFTVLEIGARPVAQRRESFHPLLDVFPGSRILAFEIEEKLCRELNERAPPGLRYFPVALGCKEETRALYETVHPMCTSLYRPNEELLALYNAMEVSILKSIGSVETVSLDYFVKHNGVGRVDFIKIDIQGAELDVFRGGVATLADTLAIVSEVEFIPHYIDQPLFGDVCKFLAEQRFQFHKFLGLAGRALKPFVVNNRPEFAIQHMWTDAMFIRDVRDLPALSGDELLRMGTLAFLYFSPDVTFNCFRLLDERNGTDLCRQVFSSIPMRVRQL